MVVIGSEKVIEIVSVEDGERIPPSPLKILMLEIVTPLAFTAPSEVNRIKNSTGPVVGISNVYLMLETPVRVASVVMAPSRLSQLKV